MSDSDSSRSDDEVDYVDIPLVEEDSDVETESELPTDRVDNNNTETNVNKKKRKLELLRAMRSEKKKALKSDSTDEIDLSIPGNQYDFLIHHTGNCNISNKITVNDIVEVGDKCPLNMVNSVELSGVKRCLKSGNFEAGSPVCIIVCSSAIRCTQVIANLSNRYKCRIAKLFAKHMKVEEQVELLKKSFPIAVGTPSRMNRLVELGALHLSQCTTVILDITPDIKQVQLLNSHETQKDTFDFIETAVCPELDHLKISLIKEQCHVNTVRKKPSQSKKSSFLGRKGI